MLAQDLLLSILLPVLLATAVAGASELIEAAPMTDGIVIVTFRDGKAIKETIGKGYNGRIESDPLDAERAANPQSFRISSADDPSYKEPASPAKVGRKAKGTDYARVEQWKIGHALTHWVYLVLPRPLQRGKTYTVDVGALAKGKTTAQFTFDETACRSEAVQVNQLGFVPSAARKYAYLSHWMGTLGALSLDGYAQRDFHLVDAKTGGKVFSGKPRLRKRADSPDDQYKGNYARADIWELDFSSFATPGEYRVAVEGIGCSFPFRLDEDVYREAFVAVMRGLYHQRCGVELKEPYTRYARKRCHHPDDRVILQSGHQKMIRGNAFTQLPARKTGERVAYWGGYHDAGDWDRGAQHLTVSDCLLAIFEFAPGRFADGELNIPESGNGIPDIVDEARFNLDCYRRMQKPHGGVCGGLESTEHPAWGDASWTDSLELFAYAPDPDASFRYAATACKMHRALNSLGKKEEAEGYLASARKAWDWAVQQDVSDAALGALVREADPKADAAACARAAKSIQATVRDVRLHAAAELFKATGDARYHDAFKADLKVDQPTAPLAQYNQYEQEWAVWVYATTDRPEVDKALQARLREACLAYARTGFLDTADKRGRRIGYSWAKPFGHTALTTPQNLPLIFAHRIGGDAAFLAQMTLNCDVALGGNALNLCWVTHLGDRPVAAINHHDSYYGGYDDPPIPGIVPYGPTRYRPYDGPGKCNWTHSWAQKSAFPDAKEWPPEELWFNTHMSPPTSEYTVTETLGPAAAAYGYLCAKRAK